MKDKKSLCIAIMFFLAGIIIGFFIAPMKNGISCGNNSGNTNYYTGEKEETSEEAKFHMITGGDDA